MQIKWSEINCLNNIILITYTPVSFNKNWYSKALGKQGLQCLEVAKLKYEYETIYANSKDSQTNEQTNIVY